MKKRVLSLLLCLIMALSLIPTAAFATEVADVEEPATAVENATAVEPQAAADSQVAVQKGGHGWPVSDPTYDHIDVRVAGKLTITKKVNGVVTGTPQTVNVTVSEVSATVNGNAVNFYKKPGQGTENEWRVDRSGLKTSDTITINCTLTINDNNTTVDFNKTYSEAELKAAVQECPNHHGFDINITAEQIDDTITKTVGFFTANEDQGLLNTNQKKVIHEDLVVGTAFPATPTTDAKEGYELDGWYAADENGEKTGTEKVTNFPATVTDNAYYVAVWKAKAPATGSLTIEKKVTAPDGANIPASFTFTVTGPNDYRHEVIVTAAENWTKTLTGLPVGTYTVTETDANIDGYKLTTTYAGTTNGSEVTISDANTTIGVTNTYEKVYGDDQINRASLTIVKKDARTGEVLPNVEFTLTGMEGNSIEVTNSEGKATFNSLQPGSYTLKETGVPAGYATWNLDLPILVKANDQPTKEELVGDKFVKTYDCTATIDVNANQNIVYYFNQMFTFEYGALVLFNEPIASVSVDVTKKVEQLGNASGEGTFTFHAKLNLEHSLGGQVAADAFPGYPSDIHLYLDGTELRADNEGIYTFQLTASSKAAATAKLEVKGTMYDLYDLFVYVWEEAGTADHWTYDTEMQGFNIGYDRDTNTYTTVIGFDPVTELTFVNQYDYTYTATLDITKIVERKRGSRNPGKADFTFEASYVDPSNKEKEVLVELDSLTIKTTGGEKRYTEGWTLTIPEKAFDEEGWAVLVISEVNGKLSGWTYDKEVYTLYVSKNGEIFNGGIPQTLNDNEEVVPGINLEFTNSYYKRTSSPNPPENKPVKSVKTGDMGIAMYAMTSLLSLGGAALVIKKRKDEK